MADQHGPQDAHESAFTLEVALPTELILTTSVVKVTAEGTHGLFTLLPNHIDFVAILVPSILTYDEGEHQEKHLAVDAGILVKCGDTVTVATTEAVTGELETLAETVEQRYRHLNEQQRETQAVLTRLEAGFLRGLMHMGGEREPIQ